MKAVAMCVNEDCRSTLFFVNMRYEAQSLTIEYECHKCREKIVLVEEDFQGYILRSFIKGSNNEKKEVKANESLQPEPPTPPKPPEPPPERQPEV